MRAILIIAALAACAAAHAEPVSRPQAQIQRGDLRTAPRVAAAPPAVQGDIESQVTLVMMQSAKDADADLRALMESMRQMQRQKQKARHPTGESASASPCRTESVARWKQCVGTVERRIATLPAADRAALQADLDALKADLDSMSEMGEMESLRLQMAMDRLSKVMATLSNVLKKRSDSQSTITQNIK